MMQTRLKRLATGVGVLAALALGGSAGAGAAIPSSGSPSTMAAQPASGRGGLPAPDAAQALHLTDHEQYVRHHKRLASVA